MTCKLPANEKIMRSYLRHTKRVIDEMLNKGTYPDKFEVDNGIINTRDLPWGATEIVPSGVRTIKFSYHEPTLRKAKKKIYQTFYH